MNLCRQCPQLTDLCIAGSRWLVRTEFQRVAELPNLKSLNVSRTKITDDCIAAVSASKSLEVPTYDSLTKSIYIY